MDNFKPGDTVQLKSGGPVMTVRSLDREYAVCNWFDEGGTPHERAFHVSQLKAAEPEDNRPYIA
jgi:uncharacterized protein YodC (DUF2158 family)